MTEVQDTSTDLLSRALNLDALSQYLTAHGVEHGELKASLISGGKSNLTFRVNDGKNRWILRRPPLGDYARGAHDVSREYRIMTGLQHSAVPVPETVILDDAGEALGAPFYLMVECPGMVYRTREDVEPLSVDDRRAVGNALIDGLIALHEVDADAVGLGTLGKPEGFLQRQLDRWQRQYHSFAVRDLPQVDELAEQLRATQPESMHASIVHGDYRLDNVIIDESNPANIRAILDWEMGTLGDALADLGTFLMFWDEVGRPFNPISGGLTAFEGFPTRAEVLERYAAQRGVSLDDIDWYLRFSEFKLAIILEQIHTRHVTGQTIGEGFEGLDAMVDQLLTPPDQRVS